MLLFFCFFFADRSLLTRDGGRVGGVGWDGGWGYSVYPKVETQADMCADIAVIFI